MLVLLFVMVLIQLSHTATGFVHTICHGPQSHAILSGSVMHTKRRNMFLPSAKCGEQPWLHGRSGVFNHRDRVSQPLLHISPMATTLFASENSDEGHDSGVISTPSTNAADSFTPAESGESASNKKNRNPFGFIKRLILMSIINLQLGLLNTQLFIKKQWSNFTKKKFLPFKFNSDGTIDITDTQGMSNTSNTSIKGKLVKVLLTILRPFWMIANPILKPFFKVLVVISKNRKLQIRLSLLMASTFLLRKYVMFTKSLTTEVPYSEFVKLVTEDPASVKGLKVSPTNFFFLYNGRQAFSRVLPSTVPPFLIDMLLKANVNFSAAPAPTNILSIIYTCAYAYFLWTWSSRMMQGPQDAGAGKRRDKILQDSNLSFADIAGQEQAKVQVMEVCEMLRFPQAYTKIGARLPSGCLLVGPPGTGKTLLARVAAAEAGVPFYSCSATDFVEVFVGRGPSRVRKLFAQAAATAPCIVFIDEIDSLGRSRRMGSMNSEQENTLNQLLTSMDGLDTSNNGVIVMAATNRYELLDPALLRAGRFDRIINCPLPDKEGRVSILKVHARSLKVAPDVDFDKIGKLTAGSCGADLSAIVNEAAISTARRQGDIITNADFDYAVKTFYSGRGIPLAGLGEAIIPSWLRGVGSGGKDEGRAAPAM